jgi:uroporphyrin-III C-methyltransferase / precorrin-2 dehydrogenase / sirohydrochlorin ferrochelatase
MDYFPAFMNLRDRKSVVIGGGPVAARKAAMLARAGADVTIVAPHVTEPLSAEIAAGNYTHHAELFAGHHLNGATLVIAATNDRHINKQVARHGRLRGVPVNVVDDAELSSFIMPAIIDRAPVTIAISTGGASPILARWVRARIETALPTALGRLAVLAGRMRRTVKTRIPHMATRRRFWEQILDGPVADLALAGQDEAAAAIIARALSNVGPEDGQIWLVGAGPGDPELLTIKALRALQSADAIVHDRLVSDGVLDLARRDADRIDVGKMARRDIGDLLVNLAGDGKRVVRLTDGNRSRADNMATLTRAGIVCTVIPGVTAVDQTQPEFRKTESAA